VGGGPVRPARTPRVAAVPHAIRAVSLVAPVELADPLRRIVRHGGHGGHGGRGHAASQQPEEVPLAALDRIICSAIALLKFVVGEGGFAVDTS
jgi:hypothetical protein